MVREEYVMNQNQTYEDIYEMCKRHMHSYVLVETTDGLQTDGIITGVDEENLYLAVPLEQNEAAQMQGNPNPSPNQFGRYPYYGGPGFGYGFGRPRRRFRRLIIPLAFVAALSLLPWY